MKSYTHEITPYLLAISEGTIIGGLLRPGYEAAWIQLFQTKMMRYDVNNITNKWEGDQSSEMAGSVDLWKAMVDFFKANDAKIADEKIEEVRNALNSALKGLLATDEKYTAFFSDNALAQSSAEEAMSWGIAQAQEKGAPNDSVKSAVGKTAVAVWCFRVRHELHLAMLLAEKDYDVLLSRTIGALERLAKSPWKVSEVFPAGTAPARMVMHDLLDIEENVNTLQHLSAKGRNRILLMLEGYGGFQIRAHEATVEVAGTYLGKTGIYIRGVILDPNAEDNPPNYADVIAAQHSVPYYGNLTFNAGKELSEQTTLGWVASAVGAVTDFTVVEHKTFLDICSPGTANLGKLVLYLNWYLGGTASWYHTRAGDTSGTLMREEPTPDHLLVVSKAMKIDAHFRIQDVIACSKLPKDGSISDLVHHTLDYRRGDIVVYKRKNKIGLAVVGQFKPEDCQFQMLETLGADQDEKKSFGILGDLTANAGKLFGRKK